MDRKAFVKTTGIGIGASLIPGFAPGKSEASEYLSTDTINEHDLWVLGHKITLYKETSGNFDLAIGVTPPNVPGPPPHHHETYDEIFLVLEGEMAFTVAEKVIKTHPGAMVDIPKNTIHTFSNIGNKPCKWFNVHSPKGFSTFFETFGIKATESDALQKSVDENIIAQVIQKSPEFDMIIVK